MADHKNPADIEREIEAERSAFAQTVGELQDRYAPDKLVAALSDSLGHVSGDLANSVTDAVRRNPVPSALIGFGLAWLAASSAKRPKDNDDQDSLAPSTGLEQSENFDARVAAADAAMKSDQRDASDDFMTDIRQHLTDWGSLARSRADALADRLFAGTEGMSEEARRRIVEAREAALHAQLRAEAAVQRASKSLARTAQAQPLTIGAVALAAGAAFGAALPRTAREDEVLGAHRDRLFAEADRVFREETRKLAKVAEAAAEEAYSISQNAPTIGDDRSDPQRSDTSASTIARRAADAAREEARRQDIGHVSRA